jgi:outer membrane protein OmpA-like peptidoglycan-associated protein
MILVTGSVRVAAAALLVLAAACRSVQAPPALEQARALFDQLQEAGADQRVSGEMLRAREALSVANAAVDDKAADEYLAGVSMIALRTVQTAEAADARVAAERAADSLRQARSQRMVAMTQAQRDSLAAAARALEERNTQVTQEADSLRRAAEEANRRLNEALGQLRTLVTEITNLQETSRGLVISLSDILFDVDKATLKPGAEASVRRIAAVLQQYPQHEIAVEGHTDATGPDAYNQRLSEQRAASVREALVRGGVDAARITSAGFGESRPVAGNDTPAGRQQNRRVEVVVLGAGTVADAMRARQDSAGAPPPNPPR